MGWSQTKSKNEFEAALLINVTPNRNWISLSHRNLNSCPNVKQAAQEIEETLMALDLGQPIREKNEGLCNPRHKNV